MQVEYAIEHINNDALVIGVLAKDGNVINQFFQFPLNEFSNKYLTPTVIGVVLAAEKKEVSKLFVPTR